MPCVPWPTPRGQLLPGHSPAVRAPGGSDALEQLQEQLRAHRDDPRLVAVGEIGLTFCTGPAAPRHARAPGAVLPRATAPGRAFDLPVVLHVRRSADRLLKHLREVGAGRLPLAWHCPYVQWQRRTGGVHRPGAGAGVWLAQSPSSAPCACAVVVQPAAVQPSCWRRTRRHCAPVALRGCPAACGGQAQGATTRPATAHR